MKEITVEEVFEAVKELLFASRSRYDNDAKRSSK
jgi:hypothetical protein